MTRYAHHRLKEGRPARQFRRSSTLVRLFAPFYRAIHFRRSLESNAERLERVCLDARPRRGEAVTLNKPIGIMLESRATTRDTNQTQAFSSIFDRSIAQSA